eukprot:COSAG02_NODE_1279_length_13487_cov_7.611696_10_plen_61_part_00
MMIPKEKQSTLLSYFPPSITSGEMMAEVLYLYGIQSVSMNATAVYLFPVVACLLARELAL